jgi:hypothetical protein
MAATLVSRFAFANTEQKHSSKFPTCLEVRYEARRAGKDAVQYRNYFSLESELPGLTTASRRGIVTALVKRLSNPSKDESNTRILMYNLRLKALVLAFFGGREFPEIAARDLSSHPGYDEVHSESEKAILCGFFTAVTNFQQGNTFTARASFDAADKAFGGLRHTEWLRRSQ